jgi:hypothetical protein
MVSPGDVTMSPSPSYSSLRLQANTTMPPSGGIVVILIGIRDQWKNRYRMTSTIAGTPRIQARKYLPMI